MSQARALFFSLDDLAHAEQIIGHLDERGFLADFNPRSEILAKVQQFDPPGIAARSLQECLLLQLPHPSLAYTWVRDHYDSLLEGHCPKSVRKELSSLNFYPGAKFQSCPTPSRIPDIILEPTDSGLQITINEEPLPRFQLIHSPELPHFFRAGKWVEKILSRRRHILTQIMQALFKIHREFFFGNGALHPLSLQQMARELGLNASTVARAVKDKYVACPRGIFLLKDFFPYSHAKAKKILKELIIAEDKQKPYSDQALMRLMCEAGIPCARRTIAKYRRLLRIPTASRRRRAIE
jgi:RNA polymerase sigma-54 factor